MLLKSWATPAANWPIGLHLLRLAQLPLQQNAFRHVLGQQQHVGFVRQRPRGDSDTNTSCKAPSLVRILAS